MDPSALNHAPVGRSLWASRPRGCQLERRRCALRLLVVSTIVVANVLPAAAAQARSPACKTKAAKTLLTSKHARVFKQRGRIYACLYRPGRSFQIGGRNAAGGNTDIANLRLAGRFVAYSRSQSGIRLAAKELRRGKVVRDTPATVATTPGLTAVTDLELKLNGSLAWIVKRTPLDAPLSPYAMPGTSQPQYEVRKSDRTGDAVLDSGPDIAPASLALRRGTASWMKGTSTFSATLD